MVAPYVGAWIETIYVSKYVTKDMSHPMWVRGLKHFGNGISILYKQSHPMWVRGLKLL